jgi:hypothetical protein
MFFAQLGKPMFNATVSLVTVSPTVIFTPKSDEWSDVYSIVISTNDTTADVITISDGTTNLVYLIGGGAPNPPIMDQGTIPVRFKKGTAITATASTITGGKTIIINVRGLTSKT